MRTSVVIPTHNRRLGLAGLLADLDAQTNVTDDITIVVVTSPSGEDVTDLVEQARQRGQQIELVSTTNRIGAKRNAGARARECERLIFFDDDMRLGPHVVASHIAAQERWADTIVCGAVDFPESWRQRSNYYHFKQTRHLNAESGITGGQVPPNAIVTMNLSMPRAVFDRLGGFDDAFSEYGGEDVDLGFRAHAAAIAIRLDLAAVARHEEIQLDVAGYARKLYTNAYFSTPRVLERTPDAATVLTWALTETDIPVSGPRALMRMFAGALARPAAVSRLVRLLKATDARRGLYCSLAYKALTILVQRVAADDRRAGRPARAEMFA